MDWNISFELGLVGNFQLGQQTSSHLDKFVVYNRHQTISRPDFRLISILRSFFPFSPNSRAWATTSSPKADHHISRHAPTCVLPRHMKHDECILRAPLQDHDTTNDMSDHNHSCLSMSGNFALGSTVSVSQPAGGAVSRFC